MYIILKITTLAKYSKRTDTEVSTDQKGDKRQTELSCPLVTSDHMLYVDPSAKIYS